MGLLRTSSREVLPAFRVLPPSLRALRKDLGEEQSSPLAATPFILSQLPRPAPLAAPQLQHTPVMLPSKGSFCACVKQDENAANCHGGPPAGLQQQQDCSSNSSSAPALQNSSPLTSRPDTACLRRQKSDETPFLRTDYSSHLCENTARTTPGHVRDAQKQRAPKPMPRSCSLAQHRAKTRVFPARPSEPTSKQPWLSSTCIVLRP